VSSNFVNKYWKHKKTILKSLKFCLHEIESIIPTDEIKSNVFLQHDLTNNIINIHNLIELVNYKSGGDDWYLLSQIVTQNSEAITTGLQSYISALQKSMIDVRQSITIPLDLEFTNRELEEAKNALKELFPSNEVVEK